MRKFEYDAEDKFFKIDPKFLSKGLDEAEKNKYSSIRVMAMDFRDDKLSLDASDLVGRTWIKRLILDDDLYVAAEESKLLERLTDLEELTVKQYAPLDFSKFKRLRELVFSYGTILPRLEQVTSLKYLYLANWQDENLPKNIGDISATEVRISASLKLGSIEPLFSLSNLKKLMLQDLPKLSVDKRVNKLKSLQELYVERCSWTDFSELKSTTLEDLFVSKVQSLDFIKNLKRLCKLSFWDCVDGNMLPILAHPTLKEIYFAPQKRHYSHKEKFLQEHLQGRTEG
ncbi:MAG: hypothetical protein ABIN99_06290 [Nitrosospira sp.]